MALQVHPRSIIWH